MEIKPEQYEKLGAFYLGREYDVNTSSMTDDLVLYDAKDLTTHGVCVGMTGSGKTGLCISLLEEAAIDGVPAIVIDPKGDISNLLLTFPELRAQDFRPWINEDSARQKGVSADEYAAAQADLWKGGLASWGQTGERIGRLRESADVTVYTPGSESGVPVSILRSFDAPPEAVREDGDAFRDLVSSTATSVLGLLGLEGDPLTSREHILLSNILAGAWTEGKPMDLASLIAAVQNPGIDRIGVMELESFFPAKDRFELAMRFNNLLASPGFSTWMEGEALDIDKMLYGADGSPRIALFSIAHLSDEERMFFVSLLLNQTLGWMRTKTGTSSLRALLYIDEIFGFMPPVANPPSKPPLLTMLKQARAYGLGLLLATQNPMDLDYKGLSNTGTWFIGRLQTERDKLRLIEGLESATGTGMDRATIDRLISSLDKRVFLLHNVHEREPVTFHTRWAMSYLAGPLSRAQIKELMADRRAAAVQSAPASEPGKEAAVAAPILPPDVDQRFLPARRAGSLVYRPHVFGAARVHFVNTRKGLQHEDTVTAMAPLRDGEPLDWSQAVALALAARDLATSPEPEIGFAALPDKAATAKSVKSWRNAFEDELYRTKRYELHTYTPLKLYSEPGESERDFRIRISDAIREQRDGEIEKLRDKYAKRLERLEERIRKAEQKVEKEADQAESTKMQNYLNVGTTILSAFLGRKKISRTTIGKASTAMRGVSRTQKEQRDVERAIEDLETRQDELDEMNEELTEAIEDLQDKFDPLHIELDTTQLKPRKTDIDVTEVAIAWAPFRDGEPAWD